MDSMSWEIPLALNKELLSCLLIAPETVSATNCPGFMKMVRGAGAAAAASALLGANKVAVVMATTKQKAKTKRKMRGEAAIPLYCILFNR